MQVYFGKFYSGLDRSIVFAHFPAIMAENKKQKVIITGAAGLLGQALVDGFCKNYLVYGIYFNTKPDNYSSDNLEMTQADLSDQSEVRQLIDKIQPDIIVNSAGWVDVDGCESDKARAENSNYLIVKNIVDQIAGTSTFLIQISTDYIFDGSSHPGKLDDPPNPLNYYGKTKLMAEEYITSNCSQYLIARTCALLGNPNAGRTNLINYFCDKLGAGESVSAPDDQYANPIWITNLAELVLESADNRITGVAHLGGADYLSRYQFARIFADIFGFDAELIKPVPASSQKRPARRPQFAGLDISDTQLRYKTKFLKVAEALQLIRKSVQ